MRLFLFILFFGIQSQADFNFQGCVDLVKYVNGALPQKFEDLTLKSLYCESLDEHLNFNFNMPLDDANSLSFFDRQIMYKELKAKYIHIICKSARRAWNVTEQIRLNFYDRQKQGIMSVEITPNTCSK